MLNTIIASTLFFAQWVCGAACNDCTQTDTWFRHTVQLLPEPSSFHISVACNTNFMVYVNERNISNAPLLRPGYYDFVVNTNSKYADIAVKTENVSVSDKTPGIWLNAWGEGFSILADDTWQDPTIPLAPCKIETDYNIPWHTPEKPQMRSISHYRTFDDSDSTIVYDFGKSITGHIRLTLRGAMKGETIRINRIPFKATGHSDEQFETPLTTRQCGIAVIESEYGQLRKKIWNIEAIEIW